MTPFFELVNQWNKMNYNDMYIHTESNLRIFYNDVPWSPFNMRRKRTVCKMCKGISITYIPRHIPKHVMICSLCYHGILKQTKQYMYGIFHKIRIIEIQKKLNEEIIEIGLHPDRIKQTQLYYYNWNID